MLGAVIGDIIGSRFEWDNIKTKEFELFTEDCFFTDDSVMTLSIADAFYKCNGDYNNLSDLTVKSMQSIGRQYPNCGYGGSFYQWMFSDHPEPYNSYGNGAAMRVSAAGYYAKSLEEAKELSYKVTAITHNHAEGLKGAEATAVAIFLARDGKSKEDIREYLSKNYYLLNFKLDDIRNSYAFNESCQGTVPQAIEAFLESTSFEDAIRNAISIGGDSDTLGAITGSIAEAYYGITDKIITQAKEYLNDELLGIINKEYNTKSKKTIKKQAESKGEKTVAVNGSDIGFEKQLWEAACLLRGNLNAGDYKNVVLGLIFLKYVSDSFKNRYRELIEEGEGFEEDYDEYNRVGVFFVPPSARWEEICKYSRSPEIGIKIDEAMQSIEKENKRLKGVLPQNFARPELDKRRLGEVVDLFTNIKMADQGNDKDLLGRAYEYCLSNFASLEGKQAGEFYTPSCVVRTLVEVLKPYNGRVYDPCCGSGGMFVQSAKFIANHQGRIRDIAIYGQEANPDTWKLCMINLAIRGIDADLGKHYADTFFNDCHPQLKADYIMANPPFNISNWGADKLTNDVRWKYGVPPNGNANYAWIQHMIHHLSPNGKIGLVLANGSLATKTGGEGEIRKKIIEDDLVECIIAMPTQLFYTASIPVTLWFLSKKKPQKGKTLFIDARKLGTMQTRKLRELTDDDISLIASTVDRWQEDKEYQDISGFCKSSTLEEIKANDYILTPGRYVGIEEEEEDGELFEEKMIKLTGELSEMFGKSHELEEEIKKRLGAIGYEI